MRRYGWRFWIVVITVSAAVIIVGSLLVLLLPEAWQGYAFLATAAIAGTLTFWAYVRGTRSPIGGEEVTKRLIEGQGRRQEAEGQLRRTTLREGEESEEKETGAECPSELGVAVGIQGGNQEAPRDSAERVRPKPGLAEEYFTRGIAHLHRGDCDGAIANFDRAIEVRPDLAEAYFNRGTAYAENGDYDWAIADFDRAIELVPEDAEAYFNRGTAYLRQGDTDQALADLNRAIEVRPDLTCAFYTRGVICQQLGKKREAMADFQRFLELSAGGYWRQRAEERLRELGAGW